MVEPKCSCGGSKFKEKSKNCAYGWYVFVYCESCGQVQGVFKSQNI